MKINKENYPAYFLDYHEGRLSAADASALFVFLEKHPDLQDAFDAFSPVSLEPDNSIRFPAPDVLKRGIITRHNYHWYFTAYGEGDLDASEREAVEVFASGDPALSRELLLYTKARLTDSEKVLFPRKEALKRAVVVPLMPAPATTGMLTTTIPLWKYMSAAAVVMLLAGLFFLRIPEQHNPVLLTDYSMQEDIPVAMGADVPVAVAEIPSRQRVPDTSSGGIRGLTEPDRSQISGERPVRVNRTASPEPREAEKPSQEKITPAPTNRRLPAIPVAALNNPTARMARITLDPKTEFAYWTPGALPGPADELDFATGDTYTPAQTGSEDASARSGFASVIRREAIDFSKVEEHIAENRFPLWELAGAGLSRLGTFAGESLGLETEKDENGRIILFSVGDRFEARRARNSIRN